MIRDLIQMQRLEFLHDSSFLIMFVQDKFISALDMTFIMNTQLKSVWLSVHSVKIGAVTADVLKLINVL